MEKIVVSAAELGSIFRIADLADMHKSCGIEHGQFDIAFVELTCPFALVGHAKVLMAKVIRRNGAMPAMVRH